jgi:hypothetical protein
LLRMTVKISPKPKTKLPIRSSCSPIHLIVFPILGHMP